MSSWLAEKAPLLFEEILLPEATRNNLQHTSLQANPPHLLLSGPAGVGKTAAWRLLARQVLGSTWEARTHILQARDLSRSSGAMGKFEEFLRPEGSGSEDTLAGRTSLDAFDHTFSSSAADTPPPAGVECNHDAEQRAPVSRLIVIEDADYLGTIRQSYLRRMMEVSSGSARFIFTAHTPSRIIEALRSRTQHIRLAKIPRQDIERRLQEIIEEENLSPVRGILGDISHISSGNIRKAILSQNFFQFVDYSTIGKTSKVYSHQHLYVKSNLSLRKHYATEFTIGDGRKLGTSTTASSKVRWGFWIKSCPRMALKPRISWATSITF